MRVDGIQWESKLPRVVNRKTLVKLVGGSLSKFVYANQGS